ncbi:KRAB-A domain-containing protein 2-like [Helicoverpa armigera]|uniref:KRAB-A domain-containing protein 2-like n=1 Tax=Helicoverpa armigera TaxID=29058 RepID=UPI003083018A
MDYYWISKYDIMTVKNEDYLIFKNKSSDFPTVRVIARNEYFDTLEDIHKACGHGGRDKMLHAIKSKYYIPRKAIEIFLALCPTCETKKVLPKKVTVTKPIASGYFNIRGQVELMDFQSCPDGEYKWLLNYQDNATQFVSLRPLTTDNAQEVAMELMKIFMIFGPPYILQSDKRREFTTEIIAKITSMWPECKIVNRSPSHPQTQNSVEKNNQDIETMLRTWMKDNNSTNWSIGCHHVQYERNASLNHIIGKSPYKALFGRDPKAGLSGTVIPHSEEELQNLSQQESSSENNLVASATKPIKSEIEIDELSSNIEIPDQTESDPNSKLVPCCSKNLRDESATNDNKIKPVDSKDYIQTEEVENLEINSGAHTCRSSENTVDAVRDLSDEEHEGNDLNVVCKSEQDTQPQPKKVFKGTKRAAAKMENDTAKKLPPLSNGETVIISIPKADRGPLDIQNIRGKIVDFQNGVYRVGTKSGIIKNWFERHEMQISSDDYDDDILDTPISLRETVLRESLFGSKGFQKCVCRPAKNQCRTKRCACFKKNMLCSPKCHNHLTCVNK